MKKWFLIALVWCLPFVGFAWGLAGHVLVAQIAYENLKPQAQQNADGLAQRIFNDLPADQQNYLNQHAGDVSTFAKVAPLPDDWLNLTVAQIFQKFHATLPVDLKPYANELTANWHFTNVSHGYRYCNTVKPRNIVWALQILQKAYRHTNDPNAQAVIMVFIEHFVGDAHQPLHVMSAVNFLCQDDAGGNGFCIKRNRRGECVQNLHKLWDGGMGYFWRYPNIERDAINLQSNWSRQSLALPVQDLNPINWAATENQWADFIYSTPKNRYPSRQYRKQGLQIVQQQLTLAGYRLAAILSPLIAGNAH